MRRRTNRAGRKAWGDKRRIVARRRRKPPAMDRRRFKPARLHEPACPRAPRFHFFRDAQPGGLSRSGGAQSYLPVRAISIRRAMRSSVDGWVENRFAMAPPDNGLRIII